MKRIVFVNVMMLASFVHAGNTPDESQHLLLGYDSPSYDLQEVLVHQQQMVEYAPTMDYNALLVHWRQFPKRESCCTALIPKIVVAVATGIGALVYYITNQVEENS